MQSDEILKNHYPTSKMVCPTSLHTKMVFPTSLQPQKWYVPHPYPSLHNPYTILTLPPILPAGTFHFKIVCLGGNWQERMRIYNLNLTSL